MGVSRSGQASTLQRWHLYLNSLFFIIKGESNVISVIEIRR